MLQRSGAHIRGRSWWEVNNCCFLEVLKAAMHTVIGVGQDIFV